LNNDRFICTAKRYVIVGPPGANTKEVSLRMIEQLNAIEEGPVSECINLGDSIESEIIQKTEAGKLIAEAAKTHSYVDDDIVIKIMEGIIKEKEKEKCNYIIEGFPRTQR